MQSLSFPLLLAVLLSVEMGALNLVPDHVGEFFFFHGKTLFPSLYFLVRLVESLLLDRAMWSYSIIDDWADWFVFFLFHIQFRLNLVNSLFEIFIFLNLLLYRWHYALSNALYLDRFRIGALLELLYFQDVNHLRDYLLQVPDLGQSLLQLLFDLLILVSLDRLWSCF